MVERSNGSASTVHMIVSVWVRCVVRPVAMKASWRLTAAVARVQRPLGPSDQRLGGSRRLTFSNQK